VNHLQVIVETMLPGDPDLGMPCASSIDFKAHLEKYDLIDLPDKFLRMLDEVCGDRFSLSFKDLDHEQKMQAINACKLSDVRVFSAFVGHLLRAYYTSPLVLSRIGAGSIPPFPQGNSLPQDDWSVLEPVYERGQVFREIPED